MLGGINAHWVYIYFFILLLPFTNCLFQKQQTEQEHAPQKQGQQQGGKSEGGRVTASPLAKVLGREHGVDLSQISGTGPSNRVIRDDVLEFVGNLLFNLSLALIIYSTITPLLIV